MQISVYNPNSQYESELQYVFWVRDLDGNRLVWRRKPLIDGDEPHAISERLALSFLDAIRLAKDLFPYGYFMEFVAEGSAKSNKRLQALYGKKPVYIACNGRTVNEDPITRSDRWHQSRYGNLQE